jgi:carbonic anhydrase
MSTLEELIESNKKYVASFDKGEVPAPPAKHLAVITCMDSRIHVDRIFGLEPGDAHIIRNAGGHATEDAIRSLLISVWLMGTTEIVVMQHTECGMQKHTNAEIRQVLREQTGKYASGMDFLVFTDLKESVRRSVATIKNHPFMSPKVNIRGLIYDVKTGAVTPVEA